MFDVKKVNNIYSSVLIGTLMIPTHLKLVKEFENTLVLLLKWKVRYINGKKKHVYTIINVYFVKCRAILSI